MRVAFIGASHWHLPLYLEPALALPGVTRRPPPWVSASAAPRTRISGRFAAG